MNRFIEYLELDSSLEVFIFKQTSKMIDSEIEVNNKEVKELKIKKDSINFITFNSNSDTDFMIEIYPKNNIVITLSYFIKEDSSEEIKEEFKNFEEYIKMLIL